MISIRPIPIAVAAALALGAPAQAAPSMEKSDWPTPDALISAFKAICVDNAGDHKAQARVASAAPWNMTRSKDSTEAKTYYDAYPWQVALTTTDSGLKLCTVTTGSPDADTDAAARTAAVRTFSMRPADLENIEDGFYWTPTFGGREYMVMYQAQAFKNDNGPVTIASWGLSWTSK